MAVDSSSSTSLAPGFRFHPTDEELVWYYLRRKVCGKPFRFDAISDVDLYKFEPWDLPEKSRLKSRDLEWYFFGVLDKKYGNGSKTNRATDRGYWKTTGKDRAVYHKSKLVGMKKTLVYHSGRAPRGERTNWVMHEYRLIDEELEKAGIAQDAFVLCRIFRKSGSGPRNGEQYGAPFIEEEWEDDEFALIPKEEYPEELHVGDDDYIDADELDRILAADASEEDGFLPSKIDSGDGGCTVDMPWEYVNDAGKFLVDDGDEDQPKTEQADEPKLFDLPVQNEINLKPVKHEYIPEPSDGENSLDDDYLLDEPFFGFADNPELDNLLVEVDDVKTITESDPGFNMLDYRTYYDATADNLYYPFDSSIGSDDLISGSNVNGRMELVTKASQELLAGQGNDVASSSNKASAKLESDIQHPFIKHLLGDIPAPPAFALEFPTKEAALHLKAASHSSSPIHVQAGMIRLRNMTTGVDWSFDKNGQLNVILSFALPQNEGSYVGSQAVGVLRGKVHLTTSRGWLYCAFLWLLILSMSLKYFGAFVCAC